MTDTKRWLELGFWLALAGTGFALTFEFSAEPGSYRWGAASWPRAILLLMLVFALAQFTFGARRHNTPPAAASGGRLRQTALFALPLLYLALLPKVGFYAATPVFLLLLLWLWGERRWGYLLGVPLAIYALINLVFTKLFYVALPTGTLPGFYDFSNWLIVTLR